jgi:hypothetical protein
MLLNESELLLLILLLLFSRSRIANSAAGPNTNIVLQLTILASKFKSSDKGSLCVRCGYNRIGCLPTYPGLVTAVLCVLTHVVDQAMS